jgi:chromate transporter
MVAMTAPSQSVQVQEPTDIARPPQPVSLGVAVWYWLKLGFISFGGPAGQIAIMHQDLVERRRWISDRRFLHALNYCMVLPGPEAQQLATYIGWLMHKTRGGLVAGTLFVLPSLFILIALSWIYMAYGSTPAIAGILYGIKPAVTAVVVFAAYRIGSRTLKNGVLLAIAAAAFLAIFALGMPFPLIIITAAIAGYIGGRIAPAKFATGGGHDAVGRRYGAALIDDDTPAPPHALFTWKRLVRVCATGVLLWGAAITLLIARFGLDGTLAQMGWFFTKAALLTFGGAYAVLPYVYQGGVEHYGWLTAAQMIDGLALGETTPGPLIMVVAFVGFVGGWSAQFFGADSSLLAGCVAAAVVTYFTFLPSFLFIFAGGPLIETTHGNLKFTAPLTGITAAVVGVIINLAVFFAWKVLWPLGSEATPFGGAFEWPTLIIGIAAAIALFRYRVGIMPVIAGSGVLGLLYTAMVGLNGV